MSLQKIPSENLETISLITAHDIHRKPFFKLYSFKIVPNTIIALS